MKKNGPRSSFGKAGKKKKGKKYKLNGTKTSSIFYPAVEVESTNVQRYAAPNDDDDGGMNIWENNGAPAAKVIKYDQQSQGRKASKSPTRLRPNNEDA